MDEFTFCITFSFNAEGYTESTLILKGDRLVASFWLVKLDIVQSNAKGLNT